MIDKMPNSSSQERSDKTRKSILRAAIEEFSAQGLAGARTETIAKSAKVNKALLYYYFKSKIGLYEAAIEDVSGIVVERTLAALDPKHSAGERLLRIALNHFDRILTQREFQNLMQQEMVRLRQGESDAAPILVNKVFRPLIEKLQETISEGTQTGELCEADWLQIVYALFGPNIFYFLSAPMMRLALPASVFSKAGIESRRTATVQFLGHALFVDRFHGAKLAKRVLAETPMPRIKNIQFWRKVS